MSHIYKPVVEEEDAGYSIPKILVAVLLLILISTGVYIYFQKKKLKTSVTYLLDSNKQAEQDLNEMIEMYNLAIDDNTNLEDDLIDERDYLVNYRDSIKEVKNKDVQEITDYKKKITELQKTSPMQIEKAIKTNPSSINIASKTKNSASEETKEAAKEESSFSDVTDSLDSTAIPANKTKTLPTNLNTTFTRVEIPPTYPGCNKGTPTQKKACFTNKITKHLYRKFNPSIVSDLNLSAGKKKIWIAFDVDKFGNVVNVKARAPKEIASNAKKIIEREAVRVIKKLPKMTAAKQNGNAVQISYSIPLILIVPE